MPHKEVAENLEQGSNMIRFAYFKNIDDILEYGLEVLRIETRSKF